MDLGIPTTYAPVIKENERFGLFISWIASLFEQKSKMKPREFPPEISVRCAVWQILRQSPPCWSCTTAALRLVFAPAVDSVDSVGISLDEITHDGITFS